MNIELTARSVTPGSKSLHEVNPTWEMVEQCIRRLDGYEYSEVSLNEADMIGMLISGGAHGRYMCERVHTDDNKVLVDPSKPEDVSVEIILNGPKDFPQHLVVGIDKRKFQNPR